MRRSLSYSEEVQVFFLASYGIGVSTSARDIELVRSWERRRIPSQVVMRGLDRALARLADTDRKISIADCMSAVETEIRRYYKRSLSEPTFSGPGESGPQPKKAKEFNELSSDSAPEPPAGSDINSLPDELEEGILPGDDVARFLLSRMRESQDDLAIRVLRETYRRAVHKQWTGLADDDWFEQVQALNDAMFDAYLALLPERERSDLEAEVQATIHAGFPMSPAAREAFVAARLRKLVRERYGLRDIFE